MTNVSSIKTTVVKYRAKPQAAVQYEIVLSSGTLVYNQNKSDTIQGSLEWQVYRIEGDKRTRMSNNATGMECYCGYSDSPSSTAGVDTTDNVTFDDDGATQRIYKSGETDKFTIIYGEKKNSVFTQLARLDVPVNVTGKDAAVVASIDFDNNNATILYNSITGSYVTESYPVSNISVVEDGVDISETAEIYIKVHKLSARIKGRGHDIPLSGGSSATLTTGKGGIISVTVNSVESTGYVLAKYIDSAGVAHTTKFNVSRSVGRYAVEIITTPTQISYNQTTGIASSSTITATLNVIDIYGNRTTNAPFTRFGAMEWRYVGADWTTYAPDPNSGQSASVLEIKNLDFTKSGVEFRFVDGSDNQLDYETVPFSSVRNGGDAYLVNAASMNIALTLLQISYGTPSGDVPNVIYMTKNNVIVVTGMKYKVPGYDKTIDINNKLVEATYNGWVFIYTFSSGKLNTKLKEVKQGAPTSVQLPIEVNDSTDNITRTIYVSYTAIQKGPAGRSYKPNTPELYDPKKKYVWNDEQRDFIYYAFTVNKEGEQDDNGVLSYFQYGVKEYNNNGSVTDPPTAKGGDTNWELVSEYKSIIVNCLFGTNAIIGGFRMTGGVQESVCTSEGERPVVDKNGNIVVDKNGNIVTETYQKPLIVINGNEGVIEFFKKKAGIRIGLDGDGNPCLMGYDTEGKCVWKLGTEVVTDYNNNVDIQIPSGSTTAIWITSGRTVNIAVRGVWKVTNMTNSPIEFTSSSLKGYFDNPLDSSSPGVMNISKSQELAVGESGTFLFSGTVSKTYANESLIPIISDNYSIKVKAMYSNEVKTQSSVVLTKQDNTRI